MNPTIRPVYLYLAILSASVSSCVSTGQYKAAQQQAAKSDSLYTWSQRTLKACQDANNDLVRQKSTLQRQMNDIDLELTASKENNTILRRQLRDLSAISSAQAESIKKSLDNIGAKDTYIQDLQFALSRRDSVNMAVLMNLKASIGGYGDKDVIIKVEKGAVSVDLSDKILFNSDSNTYVLSDKARQVLGRLARVLNDQPNVECMVVGHTDSIEMTVPGDLLRDNWDLSVKRATAIVRMLQLDFKVAPARLIASGRSEYLPVSPNDSLEGRAANRRTHIVILPPMSRLQKILERRPGQPAPIEPPPPAPAPPPAIVHTDSAAAPSSILLPADSTAPAKAPTDSTAPTKTPTDTAAAKLPADTAAPVKIPADTAATTPRPIADTAAAAKPSAGTAGTTPPPVPDSPASFDLPDAVIHEKYRSQLFC